MHVRFGPGATGKGPANGGHLASGLPVLAATPGAEIRYQCSRDVAGVLIAVWDASPDRPQARPVIDMTLDTLDVSKEHWDDNGGRGLPIVAALAASCGSTPDPSGGKWVWARLKP